MTQAQITERQIYWREHVLAAAAFNGTIVEYAAANKLKTKDLYQWKTSLTKRGFLPIEDGEATPNFAEVNIISASTPEPSNACSSVQCRLTLPCGSVLEYFNPIDPDSLSRLLSSLR